MSLMLPLIGLFIFLGLTQSTITRKNYMRTILVILVVSLIYYFRWPYD
jgi:hypothetical protein